MIATLGIDGPIVLTGKGAQGGNFVKTLIALQNLTNEFFAINATIGLGGKGRIAGQIGIILTTGRFQL
jgi:hypothetical protein